MSQHQSKKRKPTLTSSLSESLNYDAPVEDVVYAGRVVSLQMVNFMCHSNLEISFNPRVNFISGRNGSGKSAVMAALVVVLGGTATNTQRASSVAEFIKKGENQGRVSIELLNEGVNAYKPDVFGNRIWITRTFSRSGSNAYIVKSADNEVVSKKKKDIVQICEALRLDVTNPICVLNQDVARSFLTSSDSKLRYQLFMKATQLQELKNLHNGTVVELTDAFNDVERKSELLKTAKKEVDALKKKLAFMKTLEKVTEERRDLENEFLWAGVATVEETLRSVVEQKAALERKLLEIADNNKKHDGRMDELKEELNELKNQLVKISREIKKVTDEKRVVHERVLKLDREIARFESQLELSLPKLQRTMGDIKRVKDYIMEVDDRNSRSAAEYEQLAERTRKVQTELKAVEECYVAAERDMSNADETQTRVNDNLRYVGNLIKEITRNKEHKSNQLEGIRGQEDLDSVKFGPYVPTLLKAIDEAVARKQFQRKPIGPLGMYVKLNCDPQWGPAVESMVAPLMTAFCCDNQKDFDTLDKIMNRVGVKKQPTIIISKFQSQRHDVSRNRVSVPGFMSVLDAISISDNTVFNTFIDQLSIEAILLLETDKQAAAMLTHVENVPKNLRMAVILSCDKYYPAPNFRTYAGRPQNRYFDHSSRKEDVVKKLETAIADMSKELEVHIQEQKRYREEERKMTEFSSKTRTRLRELKEKRETLKVELIKLKDQEDLRPVPRTRLALEEELETLEQQLVSLEEERDAKKEKIKEFEVTCNAAREEMEVFNKKLDELEQLANQQEEKIAANGDARNALDFMQKNSEDQKKKLMEELKNTETRRIVAEDDLQHRTSEAQGICPVRVDTTRSLTEISSLLKQKERYLLAMEKMSGTKEEVMAEYREKKDAYLAKWTEECKIREHITFFSQSTNRRVELFNEKRQLGAQEVSYYFRASLLTRGYDGMLKFDFNEDELELEVHPHRNESGDKRTDAKTLSGGERSYSTVSFILAMWRAIVMPFYFLDEFDVFMDKVNRKVVMDLLLAYASEKTNTQFVFITPQDISSIPTSDTISVFKMPDPERNTS